MSETYKNQFCIIFWECLAQGMTTVEAREYATLELAKIERREA